MRAAKIVCTHLLDDFSGSAKIFSIALTDLEASGAALEVIVGSGGETGFVREAHRTSTVFYRFVRNRALRVAFFLLAQAFLFFRVAASCLLRKAEIVYANTVLVPGAILAGWICGRKVIVHLHEVNIGSQTFFKPLLLIARRASHRMICVSEYTRRALGLPREHAFVVHNSLSPHEWKVAAAISASALAERNQPFVVTMATSLKSYKGIDSFLALANRFAHIDVTASRPIQFQLVLNCELEEWRSFARRNFVPDRLSVVLRPDNIFEYYGKSALVVNLSHQSHCVETFGMTLLEAMACGVPVISPVEGGCTELFDEGRGGWRVDSRDLDALARLVADLACDEQRWMRASELALLSAQKFRFERFSAGLRAAVYGLQ